MDAELYKLVQQAVSDGIRSATWLMIIGVVIATGIGAFFGAYLKKAGETWATNQNFKKVLKQLEKTTELTEDIQSQYAPLTAYFQTKGQNLATKEDFNELLRQLRLQTEATEEIRSKWLAEQQR